MRISGRKSSAALDLHGNVNKHEKCPDGSKDENVFDIQQGVCIVIAVRNGTDQSHVYHSDLYGTREKKYETLLTSTLLGVRFDEVKLTPPQYYYCDFGLNDDNYNSFISIKDLFIESSLGVVTANDKVLVGNSPEELIKKVSNHYGLIPDSSYIHVVNYRPFDNRYIYYDTKLIERSRPNVMPSLMELNNYGFVYRRQSPDSMPASYFFICNNIMADGYIRSDNKGGESVSPLYIYQGGLGKHYNYNDSIISSIEKTLDMKLVYDNCDLIQTFNGESLMCYIYAVVYSKKYRDLYGAYIKKEYPRIYITKNKMVFSEMVKLGWKLICFHLMNRIADKYTTYHGHYDFILEKVTFEKNKIIMNKYGDYFDGVDETIWNYQIGGYLPLQKWVKDHKKTNMDEQQIKHYSNIINVLIETEIISKEIDEIIDL